MITATLLANLLGCGLMEPELPELVSDPQHVAFDASVVESGLPLASDLAIATDGTTWLLDGYRRQMVRLDEAGATAQRIALPVPAVRFAAAVDGTGWWLADPEGPAVHRIDPTGALSSSFTVRFPESEREVQPTAVLDLGDGLLVGARTGELVWLGYDGAVTRGLHDDPDGNRLGSIAELARLPDGRVVVVDTLGPNVLVIEAGGALKPWATLRGPWVGHLLKPKSAAPGPEGTLLVVDSQQGAAQLFDADGTALGVVAVGPGAAHALDLGHPIAVDAQAGKFRVLDQASGRLHTLALPAAALAHARERAKTRHLRTTLVTAPTADHTSDARLCFQCHDGIVNDERAVWDATLGHHPVGEIPEGVQPPPGFPLDEQGRLRCGTCHSPHGRSSLEELAANAEGADLARHATGTEDLFLRARRSDSALCVACHTDAAHEQVVAASRFGEGGAHPIGEALTRALAARGGEAGPLGLPPGVSGNCLDCHAVHAAGDTALRAAIGDGRTCVGCHPDRAGADHHPLPERAAPHAEGASPVGTACFACHDLVGGAKPALLQRDRGLCTQCHAEPKLVGAHASVRHDSGAPCLACHDPHAAAGPHLRDAKLVGTTVDPLGCTGCHKPDPAGARGPGALGHPVGGEAPGCADCHGSPHDPVGTRACASCHEDAKAAEERGGHGRLACAACHAPHANNPSYAKARDENPAGARCLACHAPGATGSIVHIAHWQHPIPVFEPNTPRWAALQALTLYDALGQPVKPGQNGALTCQTCHTAHGPPETGGELRKPGWEEACAACHGDDALPMYRWFHQPERRARMLGGAP